MSEIKSKQRLSDKEVIALFDKTPKSELDNGEECYLVIDHVIKDPSYAKWFHLMGTDVKTGKKKVLPIRNNVVDKFVNQHWGSSCDQWDFFAELAYHQIPMLWKQDGSRYIVPRGQGLLKEKWDILDKEMKGISDGSRKLTHEQVKARQITVLDDDGYSDLDERLDG